MISLVIPVYKNSGNIPPLVAAMEELNEELDGDFEVVCVVDGSPDDSYLQLSESLPKAGFRSQLLSLSRNFGSFAAIRAGLAATRGDLVAVMAADLQEPPELIPEFKAKLDTGEYDIAIGTRRSREDPLSSKIMSNLFWGTYRRYILPAIPPGGVDVFACTAKVRDQIVRLNENHSSLVGLLFWVGYRRCLVPYDRRTREIGVSAWTFGRKLTYLMDSVYSFSDLPIRMLTRVGLVGMLVSAVFAVVVLAGKVLGNIHVPGYAATVLVVTFFGALNAVGLGVIGGYVWRTFENSKVRPNYIVTVHDTFDGGVWRGCARSDSGRGAFEGRRQGEESQPA